MAATAAIAAVEKISPARVGTILVVISVAPAS
jgi:hypothetical protein